MPGATPETCFVPRTEDTDTTTVIKAGTAIIKGLDGADKYYLKETKAPEGYNILTEQKEVTMANANQEVEVEPRLVLSFLPPVASVPRSSTSSVQSL